MAFEYPEVAISNPQRRSKPVQVQGFLLPCLGRHSSKSLLFVLSVRRPPRYRKERQNHTFNFYLNSAFLFLWVISASSISVDNLVWQHCTANWSDGNKKKNTKKFGWQPRRMHNKHQSQSQIENVHTHIDTHANMLRECSKDGNEEKKNTEKSH